MGPEAELQCSTQRIDNELVLLQFGTELVVTDNKGVRDTIEILNRLLAQADAVEDTECQCQALPTLEAGAEADLSASVLALKPVQGSCPTGIESKSLYQRP